MKILVTFALKSEFAPWRRLHRFRPAGKGQAPAFAAQVAGAEVTAVLLGMGARNLPALAGCLSETQPDLAIVAGVAGGLAAQHRAGKILVARRVRDANPDHCRRSQALLFDMAARAGATPVECFLSMERTLRTPEEKSAQGRIADAVEMESLRVMDELALRVIPAVAIRVIVDPVDVAMPLDFQASLDARGEIRIFHALTRLLQTPRRWPRMMSFALHSYQALTTLAAFLDNYIGALSARQDLLRAQLQRV